KQRHCARAMVAHIDFEARQLRAQVIEDPVRADRARRIARIEPDQRAQMRKRRIQQRGVPSLEFRAPYHLRLTSAQRVELMPNSLMKPSASATPQSAACA